MSCAIVLYEQDARSAQRVKACSAAAWEHAVRPGMPLAEAQTLLEPGAAPIQKTEVRPCFARHDVGRDREALVELAEWCEQFSPLVGLDPGDEPDTLLLEVGGLAHLFGGEAALAQAVVTACGQQGLTVHVAIADTIDAAWGFARWSQGLSDGMRSEPGSMAVIPPGDVAERDRLPVDVLRLPVRTTEQLYLRRRAGEEAVTYPNDAIRRVLERTLGVPIFQEQVMKLAVVAAGFTPGEADQLRRAMGAWRRNGHMETFHQKLLDGMRQRGLSEEFAERVFQQIRGFGEYGFPESHAASFALLVYV